MSPERFFDLKRTDERTDVYALGKILFEAISGKMKPDQIPFKQANLPDAQTPFFQELDRIVREATVEERDERTPSVAALKEGLVDALKGFPKEASSPEPVRAAGGRRLSSFLLVSALVVLFGIAASLGFVFFHEGSHSSSDSKRASLPPLTYGDIFAGEHTPEKEAPPAESFHAKDGTTLRLVHGGKVTLKEKGGAEAEKTVAPFYMDETKVTNYQYVEFLNQLLPRIEVKNGIVRGDGRIWLLLGEVTKGCDPIGFKDGKFYVFEAPHASCPVLRVTPYGAFAYAKFHGMRLPTEAEWLLALDDDYKAPSRKGGASDQCELPPSEQSGSENLPVCSPVGHLSPMPTGSADSTLEASGAFEAACRL